LLTPSTNEALRECRPNQQRQANAVSFYFDQAHQRMGTETDETSRRALKLDCLKQSSSSYDASRSACWANSSAISVFDNTLENRSQLEVQGPSKWVAGWHAGPVARIFFFQCDFNNDA